MNKIENCSGCTACVEVCKIKAVNVEKDSKGFDCASIDYDRCVGCNKCELVCPHNDLNRPNQEYRYSYVYKSNDSDIYNASSSGGAVPGLYSYFVNNGAYVFGVRYDDNMNVCYECTNMMENTKKYMGSKYVQATVDNYFAKIVELLNNREIVFFVGVPCVVNGLKKLLEISKIDAQNLYTCDLICNGIGSPLIWKNYISFVGKLKQATPVDFKFRMKYLGDEFAPNNNTHHTMVLLDNGKIIPDESVLSHLYQNLYFKKLIMNDACYKCIYASANRVGDISLGDNTGYDKDGFEHSSLVLVNTEKGEKLLDVLRKSGSTQKINICEVVQPHLGEPTQRPDKTDSFWMSYRRLGFGFVAARFGGLNPISLYNRKRNQK